jgi:cytochrome c peroxidase
MPRTSRISTALLGCVIALTACQDAPTSLTDGPQFAKGGKGSTTPPPSSEDLVSFGELIFQDVALSLNGNQSCQSCHEPTEGFSAALATSPFETRGGVVEGSVPDAFGDRRPPSAAYATFAPLYSGGNNPTGGNFWDGRATGHTLGNPAADQALGPFLNPVEQALPHKACVVNKVLMNTTRYSGGTSYGALYPDAPVNVTWATDIAAKCATFGSTGPFFTGDSVFVNRAYNNIALAIAAFEGSTRVNRFSSKFDAGEMSALEASGQQLFGSKGKCQQCHENRGSRPLFTDFAYHNLGVPKNPNNPVYHYSTDAFDPGLGGFTGQARHQGKFRTPTTRNVGLGSNRTFMHNGALVSLTKVVDFYNTRDVLPRCTDTAVLDDPTKWGSVAFGGAGCWPAPEFGGNIDSKNMGRLGLTTNEVQAIVAYLEAMSDR